LSKKILSLLLANFIRRRRSRGPSSPPPPPGGRRRQSGGGGGGGAAAAAPKIRPDLVVVRNPNLNATVPLRSTVMATVDFCPGGPSALAPSLPLRPWQHTSPWVGGFFCPVCPITYPGKLAGDPVRPKTSGAFPCKCPLAQLSGILVSPTIGWGGEPLVSILLSKKQLFFFLHPLGQMGVYETGYGLKTSTARFCSWASSQSPRAFPPGKSSSLTTAPTASPRAGHTTTRPFR